MTDRILESEQQVVIIWIAREGHIADPTCHIKAITLQWIRIIMCARYVQWRREAHLLPSVCCYFSFFCTFWTITTNSSIAQYRTVSVTLKKSKRYFGILYFAGRKSVTYGAPVYAQSPAKEYGYKYAPLLDNTFWAIGSFLILSAGSQNGPTFKATGRG